LAGLAELVRKRIRVRREPTEERIEMGIIGGWADRVEARAQRGLMKSAVDASWVAACGIGMVYGPILAMMEAASEPTRPQVLDSLRLWLEGWQSVQNLSDRNLHRNRPSHLVAPNLLLSPILEGFSRGIGQVLQTPRDAPELVEAVRSVVDHTIQELGDFQTWTKSRSALELVGFDGTSYEDEAMRKGQEYWKGTVQALMQGMS